MSEFPLSDQHDVRGEKKPDFWGMKFHISWFRDQLKPKILVKIRKRLVLTKISTQGMQVTFNCHAFRLFRQLQPLLETWQSNSDPDNKDVSEPHALTDIRDRFIWVFYRWWSGIIEARSTYGESSLPEVIQQGVRSIFSRFDASERRE
jgi:hypothetical protein